MHKHINDEMIFVLDYCLSYVWSVVLNYPILSSSLVHVFLTTVESFIFYAFFALFDFNILKADRLRVYMCIPQDSQSYKSAIYLALKNSVLLWIGVATLSYLVSGDIHGNYAIQGIDRNTLPLEAPTFFQWLYQTLLVVTTVDFFLYWMHRAYHVGPLYKYFHSVHHEYHDTIAIHSMCAHIVEIYSALTILFIVPRVMYEFVNIHPLVVYLTPFLLTAHGVLEHCGYDDKVETLTLGLVSSSKMHMVHHQQSRYNFGFYSYLWDYVFSTMQDYDDMVYKMFRS